MFFLARLFGKRPMLIPALARKFSCDFNVSSEKSIVSPRISSRRAEGRSEDYPSLATYTKYEMKNTETYSIVTGASSGIGKSIAFELGRRHHNLLLVSLPGQGLETVAHELSIHHGIKTDWFETDLSRPLGPKQVFEWVLSNDYSVNYLVNNAGIAGTKALEEADDKYIDDRLLVNIRALVLLCRYFIPVMKKFPEAGILNVASLSAFYSIPFKSIYAASKAFVVNFSQAIRTELKSTGISVSVVCPNGVRTNEGTHARIDAHGGKVKWMTLDSSEVAEIAVKGMLRKKFLIIPGRINVLLLSFSRFIPERIRQNLLYREFHKEVIAGREVTILPELKPPVTTPIQERAANIFPPL